MTAPAKKNLSVTTEIRVRYAETDQMGVVYYANYLVWFEVGRNAFFKAVGDSYRNLEAEGVMLPVVEAACRYLASAHYDDTVAIDTTLTALTVARLTFDYSLYRDGQLLAEGYTVHAFITKDGKPINIKKRNPELWKRLSNLLLAQEEGDIWIRVASRGLEEVRHG
ncbi:MAG: acyl-CoA thioesterase [Firmicutes bacterium]|nr:acyl-CoA thioesterase [Bacillota bacterium]